MTSSGSCLVTVCNALQAQSLDLDVSSRLPKVNPFKMSLENYLFIYLFITDLWDVTSALTKVEPSQRKSGHHIGTEMCYLFTPVQSHLYKMLLANRSPRLTARQSTVQSEHCACAIASASLCSPALPRHGRGQYWIANTVKTYADNHRNMR